MDKFDSILEGDNDSEMFHEYYSLSEDIQRERERIGGDWAIASVVMLRDMRDFIRLVALVLFLAGLSIKS